MKKIFALLTIIALAFSVNGKTVEKSGKIITEERKVKNFTGVELACCGVLTLSQGNEESLVIEAPEDIMDMIETEVRGGTLVIDIKRRQLFTLFKREHSVKFTLVMKEIEEAGVSGSGKIKAKNIHSKDLDLNINGSGEFIVDGLKAEKLDVALSGSGEFDIADFNGKDIKVTISGSGDAEISGKVEEQVIKISGSGEYEAPHLVSKSADIRMSGSGDLKVNVSERLEVNMSGSGDVVYYGHPMVRSNISGSGSIHQKGSW